MIICLQNPAWCWHILKKHPLYLLPSSTWRLRWKNWNYLFGNSEGRVCNSDFYDENCHNVLSHWDSMLCQGVKFLKEKRNHQLSAFGSWPGTHLEDELAAYETSAVSQDTHLRQGCSQTLITRHKTRPLHSCVNVQAKARSLCL